MQRSNNRKNIIIMGAAGRDFHNFNVCFRKNKKYNVVAFTAAQIPNITGRTYPKELAGKLYPEGIPIYPEETLPQLIKKYHVEEVFFSYSDVSYQYLMNKASLVLSHGADFSLISPERTMLKSKKPVISVCAVRTGCGKSQTSRKVVEMLSKLGKKAVVVRHPMPYGDLRKQVCQRFASYDDLNKHKCTIEEREEYEPYIERGFIVYAGVDYEKILKKAEREADVIVWDGGNNDTPFFRPDLHIVVADPHRAGHEVSYYPGEINAMLANVVIINKINTAKESDIKEVETNIKRINPYAKIIKAESVIAVQRPDTIRGKKVVVVEDGPTVTHGDMKFGAGLIAAEMCGCKIVDPRMYATGSIKETYKKYPHLERVLPAMGYGKKQIKELEETINMIKCDAVVVGTPINLAKLLKINKPAVRVKYELDEKATRELEKIIKHFVKRFKI